MNASIQSVACIGDAQLWTVALDAPEVVAWQAFLSDDERARAGRFVFAKDRARYEAAHGALRFLLGQAVGARPASLRFTTGPQGKPALADGGGVAFNLSHSQGLALIGIGHTPIGVDVEVLRPVPAWAELAAAHFTASEQAAIARLPLARQDSAFLRCWTRKEAALKTLGCGLSVDTRSIDTAMTQPETLAAAVTVPGHGTVSVRSLHLGTSAVGALAFMQLPAASKPGRRSTDVCTA